MSSPSDSTSSGGASAGADRRASPGGSLQRTLALAFVPLCLVVGAGFWLVLLDARAVRDDLQRMFEELREVALVRTLLDELRGLEQWVEAVPDARGATHALVFADLRNHLEAATSTLRRFHTADDPSAPVHTAAELPLLGRVDEGLRAIAAGLQTDAPIGALAEPLRSALHGASVLAHAVEQESRTIGAELDHRSERLGGFMLLLGLASLATIGGLAWLLHRRVLVPTRQLRRGAVALGRGERVPLPVEHDDELGELARAFQSMADQLQESHRDLERRVAARSREVVRTARLAELGTVAAGIAHEINNPLASIVACAEGLLRDQERTPDEARLRAYLQIVQQEAMRARDITTRLLRFAHQGDHREEPVWLGAEVREVAPLFHHQFADAGVRLQLEVPPRGPVVTGDAGEWRQVVFNLLRNALDVSPAGSTVHVTAGEADGTVVLRVRDQGPGIAEAAQERLFEPFFTTKAPGKGTGLGLAIVHRIVTAHRGAIRAANVPGGGAEFCIEVPAAPAPAAGQ
ncbi:MAG: HAMP domain-containing protein [Planctomycetes bacterium]|nr:HAMP domain-containing protein [Planctomycetota bacterium]